MRRWMWFFTGACLLLALLTATLYASSAPSARLSALLAHYPVRKVLEGSNTWTYSLGARMICVYAADLPLNEIKTRLDADTLAEGFGRLSPGPGLGEWGVSERSERLILWPSSHFGYITSLPKSSFYIETLEPRHVSLGERIACLWSIAVHGRTAPAIALKKLY